jgi:sRNA-binding protein
MLTREEKERAIEILAEHYPKCFFIDPQSRQPLKKNLAMDLHHDGCPLSMVEIEQALDWYMQHFAYRYALKAGVKRIDLNGHEVGTVTETEEREAQIGIAKRKQQLKEREQSFAINTTSALVRSGRLPTDAMRKIDAPKEPAMMPHDPLARLQMHVDSLRKITEMPDTTMRKALLTAGVQVLIAEAEGLVKTPAEGEEDEA